MGQSSQWKLCQDLSCDMQVPDDHIAFRDHGIEPGISSEESSDTGEIEDSDG